MELWVLAAIALIVGSVIFCWIRQNSFSIVTCAVCGVVFVMVIIIQSTTVNDVLGEIAFMPDDLTNPPRLYTPLTSMYGHVGFNHILVNLVALIFIGVFLEQAIGTRPFVLIYFITGLAGTLAFAAVNWNQPFAGAVGASGAISGILGAAARLFPNERFTLFPIMIPMPLWLFSIVFLLIQLVIAFASTSVAWEAHVGGLVAGLLVAPMIVKMPLHRRVKRMISLSSLRKLAATPELKTILRQIEDEEVPDVKSAWIEHFLAKARCPHCGSRLRVTREAVRCEKGHIL